MPEPHPGNPLFSPGQPPSFPALRAGWRLALFLILIALLGFGVRATQRHAPAAQAVASIGPRAQLISELVFFGLFLLASAIFARLEHRRGLGAYGLPARGAFGKQFWIGVLWGVVALAALLLLLLATGDFSFGARALHGAAAAKFALAWAAVFLAVGFAEEFSFRGYTLATLTQGIGFWPAAIILSALFGAVHLGNSGEDAVGALSAGLIGFFFCFTLSRTGSLWFAIGLHAGWDWAETYLFGVPDSGFSPPGQLLAPTFHGSKWITGGAVGPEGSLLVFVVIGLLFLLFDRFYPTRRRPPGPRPEPLPQPQGA